MKSSKIIYVDHVVGPISVDVVNLLSERAEVLLYHGESIFTYNSYRSEVLLKRKNVYNKKNLKTRVISWFIFYLKVVPELVLKKKNFKLFLVSNPPLNLVLGYFFKVIFGVDYYLWVFDIYPDIIVRSGIVSERNLLVKFWIYLNKKSLAKATHVFTISDSMREEIRKCVKHDFKELSVVHNWTDTTLIKPVEKSKNLFIKTHDLHNKFIIMYSGNMGKTHDINTILETANLLRDSKEIVFVLIGEGEQKEAIISKSKEMKLANVMHFSFQSPDVFTHSIACADIGFITLGEGFEQYSVPSKTYYLLASATPIIAIANEESELSRIIGETHCGFQFSSGEAKNIASKILQIYSNPKELKLLKENSLNASKSFTIANSDVIVNKVLEK